MLGPMAGEALQRVTEYTMQRDLGCGVLGEGRGEERERERLRAEREGNEERRAERGQRGACLSQNTGRETGGGLSFS